MGRWAISSQNVPNVFRRENKTISWAPHVQTHGPHNWGSDVGPRGSSDFPRLMMIETSQNGLP